MVQMSRKAGQNNKHIIGMQVQEFCCVLLLETIVIAFYSIANRSVKECDHGNLKPCNRAIEL
jgi:hypothetical protein